MRYIKLVLDTEFCGTKNEIYLATEATDTELTAMVAEEAYSNAEQYDYMVFGWGEDAESYAEECGISVEEAEEELEQYYMEAQDCSYWEEITEEEYEEATE
jgi:hypothetical protein